MSDSGTASYYVRREGERDVSCFRSNGAEGEKGGGGEGTYQLVPPVDVHEAVEEVKDLDPEHADVRRLALARLKVHERLAEERARAEARLGHAERVAQEHLRAQQLVEQREDDAVEDVFYWRVVALVEGQVRAEQDALQVHERGVPDLARRACALAGEGREEGQCELSPDYVVGGCD